MSVSDNNEIFVVIYWRRKENQFFSVKECKGELEKNTFVSKCEDDNFRYVVVKREQKKNDEVYLLESEGFGRKLNLAVITWEIVWFLFLCLVLQYLIVLFIHFKI